MEEIYYVEERSGMILTLYSTVIFNLFLAV